MKTKRQVYAVIFLVLVGTYAINFTYAQEEQWNFSTDAENLLISSNPMNDLLAISYRDDHFVHIWNIAEEKEELKVGSVRYGYVHSYEWSPNGQMIAILYSDYSIQIWDIEQIALVKSINLGSTTIERTVLTGSLGAIAWHPTGTYVAVVESSYLHIWNINLDELKTFEVAQILETEYQNLNLTLPYTNLTDISWNPEGSKLAISDEIANVVVFEFHETNLEQVLVFPSPPQMYLKGLVPYTPTIQTSQAIDWNASGDLLAVLFNLISGEERIFNIYIYNMNTQSLESTLSTGLGEIQAIEWNEDRLAAAISSRYDENKANVVLIWQEDRYTQPIKLEGNYGIISSLNWIRTSNVLAGASLDGRVWFWGENLLTQ